MKVFSRLTAGAGVILTAGVLTGPLLPQTATAAKAPPAPWNPAIVYCVVKGPGGGPLALADTKGTTRTLLQTGRNQDFFSPRWTPDGKQIVFYRRTHDQLEPTVFVERWLCIINSDGTGYEVLYRLSADAPEYLPTGWIQDGARLRALLTLNDDWGTYTLDLATKKLTEYELPPPLYYASGPTFSRDQDPVTSGYQGFLIVSGQAPDEDGQWLTNKLELCAVPAQDGADGTLVFGTPTQINSTSDQVFSRPRISPDDSLVAYFDGQGLKVAPILGGAPWGVTGPINVYQGCTWSPDAKWIGFQGQVQTSTKEPVPGMFRVSSSGAGPATALVVGVWPDWNPKWANDLQ